MATDSKMIHSQRKSQFINLPATGQARLQEPQGSPASIRSASCGGSISGSANRDWQAPGWGHGPSTPVPKLPGDRTPRGSTPRNSRNGALNPRGRTPDFHQAARMAPMGSDGESAGDFDFFPGTQDGLRSPLTPRELERLNRQDLRNPAAVRALALQNVELKRKLGRARARSQERVSKIERERDALSAESSAWSRECESLRSLFILQQQQQIAFWTGPFMEMIAPMDGSAGFAASKSSQEVLPQTAEDEASTTPSSTCIDIPVHAQAETGFVQINLQEGAEVPSLPELSSKKSGTDTPSTTEAESVRAECVRNLRRERDYWRIVAMELKQQGLQGAFARNSEKISRQGSERSTSQSQHEGSEASRTPWSCSDSGSELSANSLQSRRNVSN